MGIPPKFTMGVFLLIMDKFMRNSPQVKLLQLYLFLLFICGCISVLDIINIPSYSTTAGLFGFSRTRLLVISILFLISIGFLVFAWRLWKHPKFGSTILEWLYYNHEHSWLYTILLVLLGLDMVFSFIVLEYSKKFPDAIVIVRRILPVFLWFVAFSILTLITFILFKILNKNREKVSKEIGKNQVNGFSRLLVNGKRRNYQIITDYLNKVLNYQAASWVIAGFFLAFILFFVPKVFINSKEIMAFPEYVPAYRFIGVDLSHMRDFSEVRLTDKIPKAWFPPFTILFFSPLLLTSLQEAYKVWVFIILFCYFLTALVFPNLIRKPKSENSLILFLFAIGLFSYGLHFELERGQFNLVTITFILSSIYIFHYKQKYRFLSYLLLAIAINLKLWPVIFVFMLINDWTDWKDILKRFSLIFGISFILFFVMGYQTFINFVKKIIWFISNHGTGVRNTSITGYVYQSQIIEWIKPFSLIIQYFYLIIFCIFFFAIIYKAIRQRESGLNPYLLLACTVGAIIIPTTSNDYRLSILTGPIAIVLMEITSTNNSRSNFISLSLIFLTSFAFASTQFSNVYKPVFFQNNFPALMAILFLVACLYYLRDQKVDTIS